MISIKEFYMKNLPVNIDQSDIDIVALTISLVLLIGVGLVALSVWS